MSLVARPRNKREIILRVAARQKDMKQVILLGVDSLSQLCWRLDVVRQVDPRKITQAVVVRQVAIQVDAVRQVAIQVAVVRQVDLREITQVVADRQVDIDLVTLLGVVDQLVTVRDAKTIR